MPEKQAPPSKSNVGLDSELELFEKIKPYIALCLNLNHDINNPLAGVLGYTEYILSEPEGLSDDQKELLEKIMECGERIRDLVAELGDAKAVLSEDVDIKTMSERYAVKPTQ